jgi:hypothetical protein
VLDVICEPRIWFDQSNQFISRSIIGPHDTEKKKRKFVFRESGDAIDKVHSLGPIKYKMLLQPI